MYFKVMFVSVFLCFPFGILAKDPAKDNEFYITLENNIFTPQILEVPANTKVRLIITNLDKEAEEFDSFDLNREKVLFPQKKSVIFVGPLQPGVYEYFGEFHPNTAVGSIIVKDPNAQLNTSSDLNSGRNSDLDSKKNERGNNAN